MTLAPPLRRIGRRAGPPLLILAVAACGGRPIQAPGLDADAPAGAGDLAAPADDLEQLPEEPVMPEDPAIFAGTYAMSAADAEGPIERVLELNGNLTALLSTRRPEASPVPVVETGSWQVSGAPDRPTAIVALDTRDGQAMDSADVITFELVAPDRLEAIIYNLDRYGAQGLQFLRSD